MNSVGEIIESLINPAYSFAENYIATELAIRGWNFNRQHPIGPYFTDFYFPDTKIVLEIDGKNFHSTPDQIEHDKIRDQYMNNLGYMVIRAYASLAKENPAGVLDALRLFPKKPRTYMLVDEKTLKNLQRLSIGIIQED